MNLLLSPGVQPRHDHLATNEDRSAIPASTSGQGLGKRGRASISDRRRHSGHNLIANNTVSLRGNIRGQMYAEERQLSQREYADSTGTLYSIYTDYPTKGVSTVDYVQSRLKPLLYNDMEGTYTQCATAEELQAALFGDATFTVNAATSAAKLSQLRRAAIHIEEYFSHLAAIYDSKEDGVITPGEWTTWKAWFKDVKTHPLLMLALYQALDNGYVTRRFAIEARDAMCQGSADNRRILEEFLGPSYGPALMEGRLDFLPESNR